MTFYFYRSHANADGQRVYKNASGQEVPAGNGYYDPRDGSIHIDLNAGDEGSAMLATIAHELTHFIQDWSPEKYRTFCKILMEGYADRGQSVRELVLAKQAKYRQELGIELTYEQAYDEVIASSMESVLNDGNVMDLLDQLETADKSLCEKFCSFLEEIADLIRRTIESFRGVHPESPEGRIVERMTEIHAQLQQVFAAGLHDGGENYRTGGQKNTAQTGGVKYSTGNNNSGFQYYHKPITLADVKLLQEIGRKSIYAFNKHELEIAQKWAYKFYREMGVKSPFFRAWFGEWRGNSQDTVEIIEQDKAQMLTNGKARNNDTGITMSWNAHDIIRETAIHAARSRISTEAINQLPEIIEKAILLDTVVSTPSSRSKMDHTAFMHSFYAVYKADGEIHVLKLYAEQALNNKGTAEFTRAYQLKDIKKVAVLGDGVSKGKPLLSGANTATINSISELVDVVKQNDPDYKPKPSSKIVNPDGTPMVVYHGTGDQFTEFRHSELSHKEGSFFFAQNREDAAGYAGDGPVMEVYVNLQNPIDYNDMPGEIYKLHDKKAQVEALKKLGYDGWMCDMDTGWGEVSAFYSEQIKSATDNIGTFDGSNPDIRYSARYQQNESAAQLLQQENDRMVEEVAGLTPLVQALRKMNGGKLRTAYLAEAVANLKDRSADIWR